MKKCVILCAGEITGALPALGEDDLLIAADGGYSHACRLGVAPHIVLGDFDSLGYIPEGAQVHPKEKDDTDAMLAVKLGLSKGYRDFYIYGGMDGPRVDHTMANFQLLHYLTEQGARGYLIGTRQMATAICDSITFPKEYTGTISVFCLGRQAQADIEGLKYSLKNGILQPSFPLGVSNQFVGAASKITVKNGTVLIIWDKEEELWNKQ